MEDISIFAKDGKEFETVGQICRFFNHCIGMEFEIQKKHDNYN